MNSEEKFKEFQEVLGENLQKYNFKKSRKGYYQREVGNCIQYIQITSTKTRGKDELHIMPIVGFIYIKLDKVIAFLKNRNYVKEFGTGALTFLLILKMMIRHMHSILMAIQILFQLLLILLIISKDMLWIFGIHAVHWKNMRICYWLKKKKWHLQQL